MNSISSCGVHILRFEGRAVKNGLKGQRNALSLLIVVAYIKKIVQKKGWYHGLQDGYFMRNIP